MDQMPQQPQYPELMNLGDQGDVDFSNIVMPPMPPPPGQNIDITGPDPNAKPMDGPKPLTQEEAKAALQALVSANFCYGSKPANGMVIQNMTPSAAYHYCLESFTETRNTSYTQVPFTGGSQSIDSAANGPAPTPWEVQVFAKEKFKDEKKLMEVPHTASVKPCNQCNATGEEKCATCSAKGQIACPSCKGNAGEQQCAACNNTGQKVCGDCSGKGIKKCGLCQGNKQLKTFVQLTVQWTNHVNHFVHQNRVSLPEDLVRGAPGQLAFKEENPWVYPISQCPEPAINKASLDFLTKHKNDYKNERLILQRQMVRIIPVTEVQCQWEGKNFTEFVYGTDNKAYSDDYPHKCCCGYCSIM